MPILVSWSCRWWQLPDVGVWPQMGMLMCFQRLVELQESTRILMDLGQPAHNPNHQYAELKVRLSQLFLHHTPAHIRQAKLAGASSRI